MCQVVSCKGSHYIIPFTAHNIENVMKQIGLKNFRKFEDLKNLHLSPITFFVGENNSGKSTVVKALLAVTDFLGDRLIIRSNEELEYLLHPKFYFNQNYFVHIGTFNRALNNHCKDGKITFTIEFEPCTIQIQVEGNASDDEQTYGDVSLITMHDLKNNIEFIINFSDDFAKIIFHKEKPEDFQTICEKLKEDISKITFGEGVPEELKHKFLSQIEERNLAYKKYFESIEKDYTITAKLSEGISNIQADGRLLFRSQSIVGILYEHICSRIYASLDLERGRDSQDDLPIPDLSEDFRQFIGTHIDFIENLRRSVWKVTTKLEYIYAHSVVQNVIYSAKDKSDYYVHTIHEFVNERIPITKQSTLYKMICAWMKSFNVGINYSIKSVGGEAHIVKIQNEDGQWVNLADKGMGSIQLMVLFFRFATMISRLGTKDDSAVRGSHITIIVEEPEQNLHPTLQSKLAELFYQIHKKYGFCFIIETHSEYMIRMTQVIVGDKHSEQDTFSSNPFKVYYFPEQDAPYDMQYKIGGMFDRKFGDGFINEAGKLHMKVLSNSQKWN